MLKKLLIAAVAVLAGVVVIGKVTKVNPLAFLKDCCHSAQNLVPPEVRLKQLNHEIDNIDKDVQKNLSRLARMEVEVKMFEEQLDGKRDRQAKLRADIRDMQKSLEKSTQNVVYRGHKVESSRLTNQLDMAVVEFTSLKEQVKTQEQLLTDKKRSLEVAHNRITAMKNEKEKLRLLATKLATHLDMVKLKQVQSDEIAFDDSAISNAREIAKDVEVQLRVAEENMKLKARYGYAEQTPVEKEGKSTDEVLKSARQALQDEEATEKVTAEKD
jgi:peptidoglycan hydrolase CwlO-like protein